MKGFKVKEKLKKSLIVTIVTIMIAFMMPVKSRADIINDFIDLLLRIPDGVMHVIDHYIGGSREFTYEELEFYGGWDEGGRVYNFIVTPYDIFSSGTYEERNGSYYTKLGLLDINFFADRPIQSETIVSSEILAPVIGNIYKALRNLAMVLMLLVVLYIGIKIMISSIAAQQAKYKQLLVDWLVGFALLFVMHYIMSGVVYLNSVVVKMLSNGEGDSYYVAFAELEDDGNASQHDTDSTWVDVVFNVANDVFYDGDDYPNKYTNFKEKRLIVRNSVLENGTFSNVGSNNANYIDDKTGRIDLESVPKGKQDGGVKILGFISVSGTSLSGGNKGYIGADASKWGENGVIYLSASIINPGDNNEQYENKAIARLNTMSYVRTISSFGSEDNDSVLLFDNGGKADMDMAGVMGFSILYLCLVIETIMFTFTYIKRVLQMSFLTMVAPIVAIMYPVDKIGDGKAQAFNTWFKDYLFNILIQPMHLLLYTIFIVAAAQLVSRNIIYALAIYGFMIPSEKYFKKILGFEKGGSAPPGPLGQALGRGLAMDGLGRLAGIGPGGHGGGKGGNGNGKGNGKIKTKKNQAPPNLPASNGGGDSAPVFKNDGGSETARTTNKKANSNGNAKNKRAPGASPYGKGVLGRLGKTVGRGFSRAVTGGEYSHLSGKNGGYKAAAKYVGRGAGRMITRGVGSILGGAVGLTAGAATAMATGDINNVFKGATVGIGAGNKLSSNVYDRGADFIEGFNNDMKQELANEDSDEGRAFNAKLRTEEAYRAVDEELRNLPDSEREDYEKMIDKMAPFVNITSVDDAKALFKMKQENGGAIKTDELAELYEDTSGMDVASHRDAWLKKKLMALKNGPDPKYTEAQIDQMIKDRDTSNTDYNDVVRKARIVETGQSYRKK